MSGSNVEKVAEANTAAVEQVAEASTAAVEEITEANTAALTDSGHDASAALEELTKAYQELATSNAEKLRSCKFGCGEDLDYVLGFIGA